MVPAAQLKVSFFFSLDSGQNYSSFRKLCYSKAVLSGRHLLKSIKKKEK